MHELNPPARTEQSPQRRGLRFCAPAPALALAFTAAFAVLALVGLGCSSDDPRDVTSSGAAERAAVASVVGDAGCAWAVRADKETLNIAYPDTSATYWATSYQLAEGQHLELRGTLPQAEYASLITYGPSGGALDALTDHEIELDEGAANPLTVMTLATPDGPPTYTAAITARPPHSDPARRNDLAAGTAEGSQPLSGTVLYRVYLPDEAGDPTGGVGLPEVSVVGPGTTRTPIATCAKPGPSAAARALVEQYGPSTDRAIPTEPIFIRPGALAATLYPNLDNLYLATIAAHEPGRVVVVTGTAPRIDRPAFHPPGVNGVRFWSVCTNEFVKPYPVSSCASHRDIALDENERFTIAISTKADRPANATAANDVTWLDWGATDTPLLVLIRHLLPSPDEPTSAANLAPESLAITSMGPYAPIGRLCTTATFETAGPTAC